MIDGAQQRRAVTAAEQALGALDAGDPGRALEAASRAFELDQVGLFASLPDAVAGAAAALAERGAVPAERWAEISVALGPGPLGAYAEERAGG